MGRGRDADVFALPGGLVRRRYRRAHDTLYEASVMQHVVAHGYPAPRVVESSGPELVMERVDGPTMLADLARRPWRMRRHARTLAMLHERLHEIPAPDWMTQRTGEGESVVHFDLHPENVILTTRGPVVIDWTNAGRGLGPLDIAYTWTIIATSIPPGGRWERFLARVGARLFARMFVGPLDRDVIEPWLVVAGAMRLRDRNLLDVERDRVRKMTGAP